MSTRWSPHFRSITEFKQKNIIDSKGMLNFRKRSVVTLALGLRPRQKGLQGCGPRLNPGVAFSCPGSAKRCEERTLTLPSELPCWELESRWTPKCLESDYKGQNPMTRRILYIIGKLLKRKCQKWARIIHLDIWNTSYGQKKGQESNCRLGITPISLCASGVLHTVGKLSTRATTLLRTSLQPEVCTQGYGAPKSRESRLLQFQDSHLRVRDKKPFRCGPRGEA